jgi:hypothetical protein
MLDTEEVGNMPQVDCYVTITGCQMCLDVGRANAHKSGKCNLFMAFCK